MIDPKQYLIQRQILWAQRHQIPLRPKFEFSRSEPHYTVRPEDNFFRISKMNSDGEADPVSSKAAGEMQALHLPQALACNVFAYWNSRKKAKPLAEALGMTGLHIRDIEIKNDPENIAINFESHLVEVILRADDDFIADLTCSYAESLPKEEEFCGLEEEYISDYPFWSEFPNTLRMVENISPHNLIFAHLDGPGLIRRALDLFRERMDKEAFMLIHLYDHLFRIDQESNWLEQALCADGVTFKALSWQQLFINLRVSVNDDDRDYLSYLMDRYF